MNARAPTVALLGGLGLAALAWSSMRAPDPRVVYNPSDSVARGWYRIGPPKSLHVGSIVLIALPGDVATLASQRGYLPAGIPLLKLIRAVQPQNVCIEDRIVSVDDVAITTALAADSQGRSMPIWQQCRALEADEIFLLSTTSPASFDSRYFGPLSASAVIGNAHPLWTWSGR